MVASPEPSVAGEAMGQVIGSLEVAVYDVVAFAVEESFAAAVAAALSRLHLLEESWPS